MSTCGAKKKSWMVDLANFSSSIHLLKGNLVSTTLTLIPTEDFFNWKQGIQTSGSIRLTRSNGCGTVSLDSCSSSTHMARPCGASQVLHCILWTQLSKAYSPRARWLDRCTQQSSTSPRYCHSLWKSKKHNLITPLTSVQRSTLERSFCSMSYRWSNPKRSNTWRLLTSTTIGIGMITLWYVDALFFNRLTIG